VTSTRCKANLERVLAHWESFDAQILVVDDGRHGNQHFCRSAAYNKGTAQTDADVLIFIEADFLVPHEQIRKAVTTASEAPGMVVPFTEYRTITPQDSELVPAGTKDPADCRPGGRANVGRNV
jgi:hypothetical protein